MEIRSAYSSKPRVQFDQSIPDPITGEVQTSMTKQSFAGESQINNIMAKYEKTGVIDHVKNHGGYVEMPSGVDYHDALNLSLDAQAAFDELPAKIRKEFDNDPETFLTFVDNPANVERMAELGLIEPAAPVVSKTEAEPELPLVVDETTAAE